MTIQSRAVVLTGFEEPLQVQEFEVPDPEPMAAVVSVEYGGVCGTDVHLHKGRLPIPTPVVLGHEAVGRIHSLGEGLTHDVLGRPLQPGDAVCWLNNINCGRCRYCLVEQQPTLCTGARRIYGINQRADAWPHLSGGWADQIYLQPGTTLVRLPDGVQLRDVIALGCAGPTAVHGVLHEVRVRFGDVVVVQGSGPVGIAAALYARLAGASKIILVGGPRQRLDQAIELGVGDVHLDVFGGSTSAERAAAVRGETLGGQGADVVIECAGAPQAVAEGIDMVRPNGQYCVLGQYTDNGDTTFNPHLITRKQLTIRGSWGVSANHYIGYVSSLPRLLQEVDLGGMLTEYELSESNKALQDVSQGAVMKAVLRAGAV